MIDPQTGKEKPKQLYQTIGYFENKKEALKALALHRVNPVSPKVDIIEKNITTRL